MSRFCHPLSCRARYGLAAGMLAALLVLTAAPCSAFTPTRVRLTAPPLLPPGVAANVIADLSGRLDSGDLARGSLVVELVDRDAFNDDLLATATAPAAGAAGQLITFQVQLPISNKDGRIVGNSGDSWQPSAELAVRFPPSTAPYGSGYDAATRTDGAPLPVSVTDPRPGPFADPGPSLSAQVGHPVVLDARDSFTTKGQLVGLIVDWGDGTVYSESPANAPDGAFDLKASHTYSQVGQYAVTVVVVDSSGGFSVASTTATVSPPPEAEVTIAPVWGRPGKMSMLNISVDRDVEVATVRLTLTFDCADSATVPLMTYDSTYGVRTGPILDGALMVVNDKNPGMLIVSGIMKDARRGHGLVAQVPLRVPDGVPSGVSYPVQLDVTMTNNAGQKVPLVVQGTTVVVHGARLTGDVDDDGVVTELDARRVVQFVAKVVDPTPDEAAAADVNGDGAITIADAMAVLRIAVGLSP